MTKHAFDRRSFLRTAGGAAAATVLSGCVPVQAPAPKSTSSTLPRRPLGKTGEELSIVGFGGIVVDRETPESAAQLVTQAVDRGVNYFDVAPTYGMAERRLGPALAPYREQVFLACKTQYRDVDGARRELERSLEYLETDHFDLYQFHAVTHTWEVDAIFGPTGAMAAFLAARDEGLIRYIGFSAHSEEAALAMMERFTFDSVLYPLNWVCWHQGNFGPRVVAKAQEQGVGILALKALALQPRQFGESITWPKCWYEAVNSAPEAARGLRWTLSQPVTAAVSPSHAELLWWACDAAEQFTPLSPEEEQQVAAQSAEYEPLFAAV